MSSMFKKALLAAIAVFSFATVSNAAVITYTLVINDGGTGVFSSGKYAVYADDSPDNNGIIGYGISITGVTTVSNVSPRTTFDDSTGTNPDVSVGFTLLRSGTSTAQPIGGTQDTVNGPTYIVQGLGQSSGTLATIPQGWDTVFPPTTSASYKSHLLIATGTYTSGTPAFGAQMSGTVLTSDSSGMVDLSTVTTASASIAPVTTTLLPQGSPEPASIGVLAMGALALLSRRRKAV
jgi:hypothetical protein